MGQISIMAEGYPEGCIQLAFAYPSNTPALPDSSDRKRQNASQSPNFIFLFSSLSSLALPRANLLTATILNWLTFLVAFVPFFFKEYFLIDEKFLFMLH